MFLYFVSTLLRPSSSSSCVLSFSTQARGKGDMINKFQKFIALFFFIWWALGAGKPSPPRPPVFGN